MASHFGDAEARYERAQKLIAEYRTLARPVWKITNERDARTGEWTYALALDRAPLQALKPLVADIASNLIHALDLVASAAYRIGNASRSKQTFFPIGQDEASDAEKSERLAKQLDREWVDFFATFRSRDSIGWAHLRLIKAVSNTSKHWQLVACDANAIAVAWNLPGQPQKIVEIPSEFFSSADRFEFWRSQEPLSANQFLFAQSIRFGGVEGLSLKTDPDTSFGVVSRFVRAVIDAAEARTKKR